MELSKIMIMVFIRLVEVFLSSIKSYDEKMKAQKEPISCFGFENFFAKLIGFFECDFYVRVNAFRWIGMGS